MRAAFQPPSSPEQGVLLALVRAPARVEAVAGALDPDDFSTAGGAALFATIAGMVEAARGEEVLPEHVGAQLEALRGADGRAGEIAAEALGMLELLQSMGTPEPTDERFEFDVRR